MRFGHRLFCSACLWRARYRDRTASRSLKLGATRCGHSPASPSVIRTIRVGIYSVPLVSAASQACDLGFRLSGFISANSITQRRASFRQYRRASRVRSEGTAMPSLAPMNGVLGVTVSSFRVYRPRGTRSYPGGGVVSPACRSGQRRNVVLIAVRGCCAAMRMAIPRT